MKTKEYVIMYPADYTWDLIPELGECLGIPVDEKALDLAIGEEDPKSPKNIISFYDPDNKENLMVVACLNDEGFHFVVLRCADAFAEKFKQKLLEVDTRMRLDGKQKVQDDLADISEDLEHGLSRLEADFGVKFD